MSSPKAAAKSARRQPAARAKPAGKAPAKPKIVAGKDNLSARAVAFAREIEQAFAKTDDAISVEAMQALMGTLCRVYSTQVDNGAKHTPVKQGQTVSPTAIIHTASALLRAGNLSVYELGFWQNATGR
ncbi:MAG: hypothetical protein AB7G35_24730 [Hyphomicrobiaceae bacterium]